MLKQIVIRGKDSDHSSVVFIYIFQQITNMAAKKYSQVYFELCKVLEKQVICGNLLAINEYI